MVDFLFWSKNDGEKWLQKFLSPYTIFFTLEFSPKLQIQYCKNSLFCIYLIKKYDD